MKFASNNNPPLAMIHSNKDRGTAKRKTFSPQDLQLRVNQLRQANDELRADNRELEELLLQARKIALQQQVALVRGASSESSNILRTNRQTSQAVTVTRAGLPFTMGPVRPPHPANTTAREQSVWSTNADDYLFGVPVSDPFEQTGEGESAYIVHLRRR